jgi:type IV secretory pathway VirB10-like protein
MEIAQSQSLREHLSRFFLKEPKPFTAKRDIDWSAVKKFGAIGVGTAVVALLLMPETKPENPTFHEKADPGTTGVVKTPEANPTEDTWAQLQSAKASVGSVPTSLDYLYQSAQSAGSGGGGGSAQSGDRSSSMVITRGGLDSKTQLPPGSRVRVRLTEKATVAGQAMPVTGVVQADIIHEDTVAIPKGAKLFGEISYDDSAERAHISWRTIQFPDGRERQISALAVGDDGQVGVEGNVHSEGVKNAIGQTITRFIGAYAEGSMSRGQLGAAEGGHTNGLKSAVAETAKDSANAWGEDLKKERKWIELSAGTESFAVLNQPFAFRDPGAVYGR